MNMDVTLRVWLALPLVILLLGPANAAAQQEEDRTRERQEERDDRDPRMVERTGTTEAELIERLRESGLTRSQVRSRLQQIGMDPGLADRYFDVIEGRREAPTGMASDRMLEAMERVGVDTGRDRDRRQIRRMPGDPFAPDTLAEDAFRRDTLEDPRRDELPVFGRSVFRQPTTQFEAIPFGPVDPGYRLGPGDQIQLVLTGDVEATHTLEVTREGNVFIPDVGRLEVAGLTLRQLDDHLLRRLSRVYSGVGRGAGATTEFDVSLGQLRPNQVFVLGEVENPGAKQVGGTATVFNALYQARGPNDYGSFRRIVVRRNGDVIREVDLYRYLIDGDSRDDIRLEQGDIIFVPPAVRQVGVRGEIRRQAIYELVEGEGLSDLLRFAGGLEARALLRRVQIDRIASPADRRPGVDRVLVDVDVEDVLRGRPVVLQDGDRVQVFGVSDERRNRIVLTGDVRRPGIYEWSPRTTLQSVLERAEGLSETAYTSRAHIFRLNESDGTRSLIRTPMLEAANGRVMEDILLADRDSVVVFSRPELRNPETVRIDGMVKEPGRYTLAQGMTVEDLILTAGGFLPGADRTAAEVARPSDDRERTERVASVSMVSLREGERGGNPSPEGGHPDLPPWTPSAAEFELGPNDRIFVRRAPGYEPPRTIAVTGEVARPGMYVLERRQERISDMLGRVGGFTSEANPEGFQLFRDENLVATNLIRATRRPGSRDDVVLEAGDSIHVPQHDPTVLVRGAVGFETRVLHVPGQPVEYYIDRAGGYQPTADARRVTITFQDGERAAAGRRWLDIGRPVPAPGSVVDVPDGEGAGVNWERVINRTLGIATSVASLIVLVDRIR